MRHAPAFVHWDTFNMISYHSYIWRSVKYTDTVCMCAHVSSNLLLIELNWDQRRQQQKLKAENERSTQVAISIIKEQKWRRGGREEGWKEMICSVNPNWITLITSLFLALFYIFFHFISNIHFPRFLLFFLSLLSTSRQYETVCLWLEREAAGWLLTTTFL